MPWWRSMTANRSRETGTQIVALDCVSFDRSWPRVCGRVPCSFLSRSVLSSQPARPWFVRRFGSVLAGASLVVANSRVHRRIHPGTTTAFGPWCVESCVRVQAFPFERIGGQSGQIQYGSGGQGHS